jgi:hypothetical protein
LKKDLIVSLILLAGSIALYASLSLMEEPAAASFPRVVIVLMGCLGLVMIIQTAIARQRHERPVLQNNHVADSGKVPTDLGTAKRFPFGTLVLCFVLIMVYFVVMEKLGFYVSAFLFFIILTFVLGRKDLTLPYICFRKKRSNAAQRCCANRHCIHLYRDPVPAVQQAPGGADTQGAAFLNPLQSKGGRHEEEMF